MPKIKVKKAAISLDMTAMCDVAFLLLTFFVLTAKAKPQEPVEVMTPSSVVDLPVPDKDVITLLIDKPGRVFIGMDNHKNSRSLWLNGMLSQFNMKLNDEQTEAFVKGNIIPVPIEQLPQFLSADGVGKKNMVDATEGIPVDTSNTETNELKDWILNARRANDKATVVIKADSKAPYSTIKRVMKTLQKQKVSRFSLLTTQASD